MISFFLARIKILSSFLVFQRRTYPKYIYWAYYRLVNVKPFRHKVLIECNIFAMIFRDLEKLFIVISGFSSLLVLALLHKATPPNSNSTSIELL